MSIFGSDKVAATAASASLFSSVNTAIEKGAATVYGAIVKAEAFVQSVEASSPLIAPILAEGVSFAKSYLLSHGLSEDVFNEVEIVGEDILASVKALAALDASVPTPLAPPATGTTVAPVTVPGALS